MNSALFLFYAFITFLIVQRLAELQISGRNTVSLLKAGGVEFGKKHYGVLVALHTFFFISLILEAFERQIKLSDEWPVFLAIFVVAQIGRVWVIRAMNGRWTTRIIVSPGVPLVNQGPFRFLPHPNYTIVAVELFTIPMLFNLYWTAMVFSLANAVVLITIRLPEENRALRWASGMHRNLEFSPRVHFSKGP